MALTSARQRNAVSQGMALGLLMCGRNALPCDKVGLDLAFEGAWRSWTYRDRFPQVNIDLAKGLDGARAFTRANARKQVWALYWEQEGGEFRISARQADWAADDPEDLDFAAGLIDGDVPLTGWEQLALEFLRRFER